jgi:hypothetical protein
VYNVGVIVCVNDIIKSNDHNRVLSTSWQYLNQVHVTANHISVSSLTMNTRF